MRREETEDGVEGERDEKISEGKEIEWGQRTRGKEGWRHKHSWLLSTWGILLTLLHTGSSIFPKQEPNAGHLSGASARACFIGSTQQAAGTGGVMFVESRSLLGWELSWLPSSLLLFSSISRCFSVKRKTAAVPGCLPVVFSVLHAFFSIPLYWD